MAQQCKGFFPGMGVDHPIPKFFVFSTLSIFSWPPAWDCNQVVFRLCCCSVVVNGVNLVINNACTTLSVVVNGVNLVINNACHRSKTSCIKV